ncbi:metallophosphoesterase [Paraburkholderia aspalathi]|nr:metallophosphoesterase [Paraburkholderia aspalathi]MBK3780113.1 metallophosphoesterase [Paraburkholderia aspalathi]
MWKAVQRFEANQAGRDFVIGDVHGAYTSIIAAMRKVRFDPARDRIFSVGDLVDRGPESHRVRQFLAQPYVKAIKGNHEDMLINLYANGAPDPKAIRFMVERNGLGWWLSVDEVEKQAILHAFRQLPIIIEVETPRGLVGMVHGDVPQGMDWPTFVSQVEAGDRDTIKAALWGRERIEQQNFDGVPGVGRIFVGHTPQWGGLRRFGNVYAVDTGAVFAELGHRDLDARQTMVELATCTQVLDVRKEPTLLDIRDTPPAELRPFGNYVTS